jgi:hypothetical protein
MSTNDYLPNQDAELVSWLKNYADTCAELQQELGLSNEKLLALENEVSQFRSAYAAYVSSRAEARGFTATKNVKKESVLATVRAFTREFKGKPNISPGDLATLGVVRSRVSRPLQLVTKLNVQPFADGTNLITWNRNGNSETTNFIIEYTSADREDYRFVASTTKTRFKHLNQTPGRPLHYRIYASRAGKQTTPCTPVSVYDTPDLAGKRNAA